MASSTAGTPTAAQPGSAKTIAGTPLSSPAPAPPTTNTAVGTAATDQPEAEQRLVLLMAEVEQLASIIRPTQLRNAADRLDALASKQAQSWRALLLDGASSASPDNSPGPVEQLSFVNEPMTHDEARIVDGSIGSIDGDDGRDGLASPLPDDGVGPLAIEETLWPGGPGAHSIEFAFVYDDARDDADGRCAPCDGDGDGDGATDGGEIGDDGGASPRDPHLGSRCRRDRIWAPCQVGLDVSYVWGVRHVNIVSNIFEYSAVSGAPAVPSYQTYPKRPKIRPRDYVHICIWLYAHGYMHMAICIWLYAHGYMHMAIWLFGYMAICI
jgi:hypothetical protein